MTQPESVLKKLKSLKSDLNGSVQKIRAVQVALAEALRQGHDENDFYPRRLKNLSDQEELHFKTLLSEVNGIIAHQFDNPFFILTSDKSMKAWIKIRTTMRYIRNSFSNNDLIANALVKLERALPKTKIK